MLQYPTNPDTAFESFIIGNDSNAIPFLGKDNWSINECLVPSPWQQMGFSQRPTPRSYTNIYNAIDGDSYSPYEVSKEATYRHQQDALEQSLTQLHSAWVSNWLPENLVAFLVVTKIDVEITNFPAKSIGNESVAIIVTIHFTPFVPIDSYHEF